MPVDKLARRLTTKTLRMPGSTVVKPLAPEEAEFNRDAIAKGASVHVLFVLGSQPLRSDSPRAALYSALFSGMVERINGILFPGRKHVRCAAPRRCAARSALRAPARPRRTRR